jgi:hypothetical protein
MKRSFAVAGGFGAALVAALLATPGTAAAHVCMDFPISRNGTEQCTARTPQKIGSCGIAGRTEHVNVFRPGQTIEVVLRETINHPSHYRISFNPDGDTFYDPVRVDDISNDHPHVLIDGIEDAEEAIQRVSITFPNIECENCTLQLIQVMYDKQRNGFGGATGGPNDNDDMYYSCADIALRRNAAATEPTEPSVPGRGRLAFIGLFAVAGLFGVAGGRALRRKA